MDFLVSKLYSPSPLLTSSNKLNVKSDTCLWGQNFVFHILNQCFHQLFAIAVWILFALTVVLIPGWHSQPLTGNFFPLLFSRRLKPIVYLTLKTQKNCKLGKLFFLIIMSRYTQMLDMYFREYLWFHCVSSIIIYKTRQSLFQIVSVWVFLLSFLRLDALTWKMKV